MMGKLSLLNFLEVKKRPIVTIVAEMDTGQEIVQMRLETVLFVMNVVKPDTLPKDVLVIVLLLGATVDLHLGAMVDLLLGATAVVVLLLGATGVHHPEGMDVHHPEVTGVHRPEGTVVLVVLLAVVLLLAVTAVVVLLLAVVLLLLVVAAMVVVLLLLVPPLVVKVLASGMVLHLPAFGGPHLLVVGLHRSVGAGPTPGITVVADSNFQHLSCLKPDYTKFERCFA